MHNITLSSPSSHSLVFDSGIRTVLLSVVEVVWCESANSRVGNKNVLTGAHVNLDHTSLEIIGFLINTDVDLNHVASL